MDNPERSARVSHRTRAARGRPGNAAFGYALVLIAVGAGLFVTGQSSRDAGVGTGLVGCALLAAAAARMIVPERYLGMLICRSKAIDVAMYGLLGGAVLGLALALP